MLYYVYILSNSNYTVLYTGVANNLIRRMYEHRNKVHPECFTAKYGANRLVYYEETSDIKSAIEREKQIKSWSRKRKDELIERCNPSWQDLYSKITQ